MESAGEDLDDIFEDNNENRENGNENNEEPNNEISEGVKVKPPKRVIKNPRLKFNPERLCGERGIPVLVDHFKNVKFKGKGHEKEDLDKLLSKLELWTHRLFPSMKFEACLQHIEKLGKKRPVQTCLRKIRLDMPIINSDFVKDDDEEDDVQRIEDSEPIEIDAFDRLIGDNHNFNPITTADSMMDSDSLSNCLPAVQRDPSPESRGQVLGSCGSSLTEEQKERLQHNRMLAIERRKARLACMSPLVNNERPTSQEDPNEQSFDSLFKQSKNSSDDLYINNNNHNDNDKNFSSKSNYSSSDNLGLDDLIDLVEEEDCISKNGTVSSTEMPEIICVNEENETVNKDEVPQCSKMEINNSDLKQSSSFSALDEKIANETDENLELESLMDLVNEDSEY